MANSEQYRPPSTTETSVDDAVSVRFYRDQLDNVDNYKAYAGAPVLVPQCWPDDTVRSPSSGTDETVILLFAPRYVIGYPRCSWSLNHECDVAGAAGEVTWRLYLSHRLWTGGSTVTAAKLSQILGPYHSRSIVASGTSVATSHDLDNLVCFPNAQRQVYLMLTAQAATSGNRCSVRGLTVVASGWV